MNNKGFSLLEMLMAAAIFSIVCVVIFGVNQIGLNSWDQISVQSNLAGEARMGIERMTKELRTSKLSNIDSSSPTQLRFKIPTAVNSSTGAISSWSNWIRYSRGGVNGNQLLRMDEGTNVATVVANEVTAVQFTANSNPSTISISLTTQKTTTNGRTIPITLSGTVELRN